MTTKYQIKAYYRTGDSFRTEDTDCTLEMEWTDLSKAKAALKRIKEHYSWYESQHSWRQDEKKEKPAFADEKYDFCLKVELDNGNEVQFGAPWCGYFEHLYSAEIVTAVDEEMRIEF